MTDQTIPSDNGDFTWMSATDISRGVRSGEFSAVEVARHFTERIERLNPDLNAFIYTDFATTIDLAAGLDARIASGEDVGPMAGVPYSLKEITAATGLPATGAIKTGEGNVATYDAAVTRRLRDAGGVLMGKTNLPEAGYWCGTDGHLYGPTQNPWNLEYSPGGSSGGAAASVAAGLTPIAEGSDGGGSVRAPAAMCGLVGFKPSTGRIPQEFYNGRFEAYLTHGPLTRTVADAALMMNVLVGPDSADPLSLPLDGIDYVESLKGELTGMRIAWSPDLGIDDSYTDPEVVALCAAAARAFEELGATVVEASPAWINVEEAMWKGLWLPAYAPVFTFADWDSMQGLVDSQLIEIIKAGAVQTGAERGIADNGRADNYRAFDSFMGDYDLLLTPTLRVAGFKSGDFGPAHLSGDVLRRQLLSWVNTYEFNLTGTPAVTVPVGITSQGLPVGLQIAGGHLQDARVLGAAAQYEAIRPWSDRHPAGY
jgi:aspartyl-tRNA(Asn)/glutamyl-tRNA(Gln) amidotransferase subunit A